MSKENVDVNYGKNRNISQSGKIQEAFLNHCRRQKVSVRLQLTDQTILDGIIIAFDQDTIVISVEGTQQLIFKSAIVCIRSYEITDLIFNEEKRRERAYSYPRLYNTTP